MKNKEIKYSTFKFMMFVMFIFMSMSLLNKAEARTLPPVVVNDDQYCDVLAMFSQRYAIARLAGEEDFKSVDDEIRYQMSLHPQSLVERVSENGKRVFARPVDTLHRSFYFYEIHIQCEFEMKNKKK